MNQSPRALIQFVLVLVVASVACDCEEVPSKSYVTIPTDSKIYQNIRGALEKLDLIEAKVNVDRLESVAEGIKEASESTDNLAHKEVYQALVELFDDGERKCYRESQRVMHVILSVYEQIDGDLETNLGKWRQLILSRGRQLFSHCLQQIYDNKLYAPDREVLWNLDEVFTAAFDLDMSKIGHPAMLTERLARFQPHQDKSFRARKMFRAIRRVTGDDETNNYVLVKRFMVDQCEKLMDNDNLRLLIAAMDVLRYLKFNQPTEANRDLKLRRIDEYSRLCLALETPKMSNAIEYNLVKMGKHTIPGRYAAVLESKKVHSSKGCCF